MKTLTIDKEWRVESDGSGCTLISEIPSTKLSKKGEKEDYIKTDRWYFPNVKMCLKRYLNESLKEESTVKAVYNKILEVENTIVNLKL